MTEQELFREQARDAYSRDFGTRAVLRDEEDDLDRRDRLRRWPIVATALVVATLVVGLFIRIPVTVSLTPVQVHGDQLLAVPSNGEPVANLGGASARVRHDGREIPVTVEGMTHWDFGNRKVAAVTLRAGDHLPEVAPSELTVVVTIGERSLIAELIASGGVTGS